MQEKRLKIYSWRQKRGPLFLLPTFSFSPKEDVDLDVMAWSVTLSVWDRNVTFLMREPVERHGPITEADIQAMSRYVSRQSQIPLEMAEMEIRSLLRDGSFRWMVAVITDGGIFNTYAMEVLQSCIKERLDKKSAPKNQNETSDDWMSGLG